MTLKKKIKKARKWAALHLKTVAVLGLALFLFLTGILLLWAISLPIPDFKAFDQRIVTESTKIYDRTGEILLYDVYRDVKRTRVPFEDISNEIKRATIAIEDDKFYEHKGVRPTAIFRAAITGIGGGSTITQQLVKNSLLTTERKISRKIKEALLAVKLEQVKTKDEILTLYLNEIPYGGNIYGVEEASQAFFGKTAKDITLAEAVYLAAIPKAPTRLSPYGSHTDELEARKNLVLDRMVILGMITPEEAEKIKAEKIIFARPEGQSIKAPHFVFMIKDYLEQNYGEGVVENRGLEVITTIDYDLQQKAEETINKFAPDIEKNFRAKNASIVAINPKNGQILALVGSRDYFDIENEGNFNIALAHRQPGSAFKPFVYATAFNKGYRPETVLFDLETQFSTNCPVDFFGDRADCYSPQNYDNKFRGPMSLRDALAQSVNVPAVKLIYLVGIKDAITTAKAMGINGLQNAAQYGLTLVLGGGEVSLLEITSAYGVFANDGVKNKPVGILEIRDRDGSTLEKFTAEPKTVLPPQTARQISDILSNTAAPQNANFIFPGRDVGAKTGTTNNYRDVWVIGYTPNLVVGSWIGNNDNSPMERRVAGFIIAPVWGDFMGKALATIPDEKFIDPAPQPSDVKPSIRGFWQGGETYTVDKITGAQATEYTPIELQEERVIPNVHNILYWVNKSDPLGPRPLNPEHDSQFNHWEWPVLKWLTNNPVTINNNEIINNDEVRDPKNQPKLEIINPRKNETVSGNLEVEIETEIKFEPLSQVDFFIDGKLINSLKNQSNNNIKITLSTTEVDKTKDSHELKITIYDIYRNKAEESVIFKLK